MDLATIRLIAATEAGRQWTQRHVQWLFVVVALIASVTTALSIRGYTARREAYTRQLQRQVAAELAASGPLMGWAVEPALRINRPPASALLWVTGAEDALPVSVDFGPGGTSWVLAPSTDNWWPAATPLDNEFLLRVLCGLVAILLGLEAALHARHERSLEAMLLLPVRPAPVLVGIGLAAALPTAVAFVVLTLASSVSALAFDRSLASETALTALVATIPALLYLTWLTWIGAILGFRFRGNVAAVGAIALWFAATIAVPQLMKWVAFVSTPATSRAEMEQVRDNAYADSIRASEEALGDFIAASSSSAKTPDIIQAIDRHHDELRLRWSQATATAREIARDVEERWRRDRRGQSALAQALTLLDPAALASQAIAAAAGSGPALADAWEQLSETHQRELNRGLFDNRRRVTVRVPSEQSRALIPVDLHPGLRVSQLPRASAPVITPQGRLRAVVGPVIGLALWLLMTAALFSVDRHRNGISTS